MVFLKHIGSRPSVASAAVIVAALEVVAAKQFVKPSNEM